MAESSQQVRALAFVANTIRSKWNTKDIERELNKDTRDFATLAIAAVRAAADVRVHSPAGIATVSGVIKSEHPSQPGTPTTTSAPARLTVCDKCDWPSDNCHCNHTPGAGPAAYRAELARLEAEKVNP